MVVVTAIAKVLRWSKRCMVTMVIFDLDMSIGILSLIQVIFIIFVSSYAINLQHGLAF